LRTKPMNSRTAPPSGFIAVIFEVPDVGFGIAFPDMPGCIASAATFDEAWGAAAAALTIHLDQMTRDGAVIPTPSSFTGVLAKRQYRTGVAIRVHPSETPASRATVCETAAP
jgi:predicted RNase H-like HicB family nuclease